jgi:hypothetical protein
MQERLFRNPKIRSSGTARSRRCVGEESRRA